MFTGLQITRRGAIVVGVLIVAAIVLLSVAVAGMFPAMGAQHITDAMWQQGLDAARKR